MDKKDNTESKRLYKEKSKIIELWNDDEKGRPAIVFLCISLALLLAIIGFFSWHTAIMRDYELNYVKIKGTVVDVEERHSSGSHATHTPSRTLNYLVISYTYNGIENTFTDRVGYNNDLSDQIGTATSIYVNPQNPMQAEKVTSAGIVSIICACFFAFFCVTYAAGTNLLLSINGNTYIKRLLFVWGAEILLGIAFLLLCWLGLPHSDFREIFVRIEGAVGVCVICQAVLIIALLDVLFSNILRIKIKKSNNNTK